MSDVVNISDLDGLMAFARAFFRPAEGWESDAACGQDGVDPTWFFPEQSTPGSRKLRQARAVCARCPVRALCLADALESPATGDGVRAGTTPQDRRFAKRLDAHPPNQIALLLHMSKVMTTTGPFRTTHPEDYLEEGEAS